MMNDVLQRIYEIGIVPVIAIDDANKAVPLAKALVRGGLPAAEVTFRTAAAEEAIRKIRAEVPEMLVGAGTVLTKEQADRALQNFFRRERLAALREIALRRCADRVNRIAEEERSLLERQDYHTGEHILVCITAAPSSAKVIRTASRLADAFHGTLTGLCVETPDTQEAGEKTKEALRNNNGAGEASGGEDCDGVRI